jgi:serine/threonine-protein kinase
MAHDLREIRDRFTNVSATNRSARATSGKRRAQSTPRRALYITIAALVFIGAASWMMWIRHQEAARERVRSLAVMPFRDLSSTAEGRMLADGISEMVAARLAEAREIRIAPPFEGTPVEGDDVKAVAKRKNVHAVVRGSVQRSGDEVRVSYSLLDAEGKTLASGSETRAATDLFALEDAVADGLLAQLGRTAPQRPRIAIAALAPADQQRYVEAVGLLRRVKDEQSVDQAILSLEAVLRNARESSAVNAQLARALLFKSHLARKPALIEQATVYATRSVLLNADDADSHATLGMLQNASGRHAEAVRSFERALALWPDKVDALIGLGDAYAHLGRAADADAMYKKAIGLRPDSPSASATYGTFLYNQGRYDDSAAQFRRATELTPDVSHAWSNFSLALQAQGRYEDALAASKKSIAIKPTAPGWTNLGTLQYALGKYDEARQSYEHASALAPSEALVWMNLGDAHRAMRSAGARDAYARAIAAARDALALNPKDARMHSRMAICLAKSGRAAEAQDAIRRALEIDPTNAQILYNAAVIATLRGNEDSAVSWLERAIASGYSAAEAARDPELEPLRGMASFRNAVKSAS